MKKILFVDRDGTILIEPKNTEQINSLDEMNFLPGVISAFKKFHSLGYEIIIVTNQDGLGTVLNPLENFNTINKKMISIFLSEEIIIKEIFICPHFSTDHCNCRKPKIGLIENYLKISKIDFQNSLMVGDRETDLIFGNNLGVKSYLLSKHLSWEKITNDYFNRTRIAEYQRKTFETSIQCNINIDGIGKYKISTGIKFFDHMLEQLSKHSSFDIELECQGDLKIDEHHTIEDTAIVLGQCFLKALDNKKGIERFAFERILVMDEAITTISIDLSSRPYIVFKADWNREYIGDFPTEMTKHFFQSFCISAGINAHFILEGENTHHKIESCFKAFAKVLHDASRIKNHDRISSTKGAL